MNGRPLYVPMAARNVARFTFNELCEKVVFQGILGHISFLICCQNSFTKV